MRHYAVFAGCIIGFGLFLLGASMLGGSGFGPCTDPTKLAFLLGITGVLVFFVGVGAGCDL